MYRTRCRQQLWGKWSGKKVSLEAVLKNSERWSWGDNGWQTVSQAASSHWKCTIADNGHYKKINCMYLGILDVRTGTANLIQRNQVWNVKDAIQSYYTLPHMLTSSSALAQTMWHSTLNTGGAGLSAEICWSLHFSNGSGALWVQISDGKRRRPPTTVGVRKLEWLPFRVVSKYPQCIVCFCHSTRVTDRWTDRQTELLQRLR